MKRQELWEKFNNEREIVNRFMYLYERWQDEREYEDINDYLKHMKQLVPEAYKISKRPFGITCRCEDGDIRIFCKVKGKYLTVNGEFL